VSPGSPEFERTSGPPLPTAEQDGATLAACATRAQGGDRLAFRELVQGSHAALFRLALYLTGDGDEAQDITQETYLRAWTHLDQLRDPALVQAWLARIVRNVAEDRRRWWRRRRAVRLDAGLLPELEEVAARAAPSMSPSDLLLAAEQASGLRDAVARLPDKLRVVLLLRDLEGASYEQIATLLELPLGTVESRLHRARQALTRRLARSAPAKERP